MRFTKKITKKTPEQFALKPFVSAIALVFLSVSGSLCAAESKTLGAGQVLQQIERDIEVRPLPKMPEIEDALPLLKTT